MDNKILGLHHVTAIAEDARRNLDFYTKVLGQRLVKKTVNFDDPETYHFYYGNYEGTPGTLITFFPWKGIRRGRNGIGMATGIGYSVPADSLDFWAERFSKLNVRHTGVTEVFGQKQLHFNDPDGLSLALVDTQQTDNREPWQTEEISAEMATRGFHSVTLTLADAAPTARILTDILGYQLFTQEGNLYRFVTPEIKTASIIDIIEAPHMPAGFNAAGTNHHIAFRVKDDNVLMEYREKVESFGLNITPKIDRDYFFSLYFREPGGVLFELATDNPGFTKDEPLSGLGTHLKLPAQHEGLRNKIEKILPKLD